MWAIGYIAVPILFYAAGDRILAGNLAGEMFKVIHYVGIAAAVLLLMGAFAGLRGAFLYQWRVWILLVMLALILTGLFVLQPAMQELIMQGLAPGSAAAASFGRLHGISSIIYLINSLLGLILVIAGILPRKYLAR